MALHFLDRLDAGIGPHHHDGVVVGRSVVLLRDDDRLNTLAVQPGTGETGGAETGGFQLARGNALHDAGIVGGREQLDRHMQMFREQLLELVIAGQAVLRVFAAQNADAEFLQCLGTGAGNTQPDSGGAHGDGLSA